MEDDEYIYYGTSLPEIEDEYAQRKKVARELEVRDEKGRQRFHGAFTGGFSAGYFNTVGTKEGWTPSSFISSRNKSAEKFQQNPEDFMDEEDLGEFGIATRKIHTSSQFRDLSEDDGKKRKYIETDSVIPGIAPLKDIVKPVRESIGIEILKKLGWKIGQGIGPRHKQSQNQGSKIYGCALPGTADAEEDDPNAHPFTFAPLDTEGITYHSKDNYFGLGYTGLSKQSVLKAQSDILSPTSTKTWLKKDRKKLSISGQAFGVGAFEDEDEDVYSKDDMSQYDFSSFEGHQLPYSKEEENEKSLKKMDNITSALDGFCLSSQPSLLKKHYPPPDLPVNYNPVRKSISRFSAQVETQPIHNKRLTADCRSLMLGEKKFFPTQSTPHKEEQNTILQQRLSLTTSSTHAHSFRPFSTDELKQTRYDDFLRLKNLAKIEELVQPLSMTEWEKQQEIEEFERASILFRPLSAALSSKFESRSTLSVEHEVIDALEKAKNEKNLTPTVKQALVGKSNRKVHEWRPSSLLCKRFNVPNPYPNSSSESESQKSLFSHLSFEKEAPTKPSFESSTSLKNIGTESVSTELSNDESGTISETWIQSKSNTAEENEIKKPPIDFFKDIFENSSSEDDIEFKEQVCEPSSISNAADTKVTEADDSSLVLSQKSTPATNKDVKKIGFGVFANIDLDALNQKYDPKPISVESCETVLKEDLPDTAKKYSPPPSQEQNYSEDLYGPDLPPDYSKSSTYNSTEYSFIKHSKHKSKHSHKHHKSKNTKKKKKKKSHRSSDDSSIDSNEDIPPSLILEKLKKLQKVMKSN